MPVVTPGLLRRFQRQLPITRFCTGRPSALELSVSQPRRKGPGRRPKGSSSLRPPDSPYKTDLRDAFYLNEPIWREKVLRRGKELFDRLSRYWERLRRAARGPNKGFTECYRGYWVGRCGD